MQNNTHWLRKHMGEIAWVARRCSSSFPLPPEQRESVEQLRSMAHTVATGAIHCNEDKASRIVALFCSSCRHGWPGQPPVECAGRNDWQARCALIARMTE